MRVGCVMRVDLDLLALDGLDAGDGRVRSPLGVPGLLILLRFEHFDGLLQLHQLPLAQTFTPASPFLLTWN